MLVRILERSPTVMTERKNTIFRRKTVCSCGDFCFQIIDAMCTGIVDLQLFIQCVIKPLLYACDGLCVPSQYEYSKDI